MDKKVSIVRDPETGRYRKMDLATNEVIVDKKKTEVVLEKLAKVEAVIKVLNQPLVVFSDRKLNPDKSSKMRVGANIEIIPTKVIAGDSRVLRVRRPGSTRTFYTTEDRISDNG
jgi:hypothetical protein